MAWATASPPTAADRGQLPHRCGADPALPERMARLSRGGRARLRGVGSLRRHGPTGGDGHGGRRDPRRPGKHLPAGDPHRVHRRGRRRGPGGLPGRTTVRPAPAAEPSRTKSGRPAVGACAGGRDPARRLGRRRRPMGGSAAGARAHGRRHHRYAVSPLPARQPARGLELGGRRRAARLPRGWIGSHRPGPAWAHLSDRSRHHGHLPGLAVPQAPSGPHRADASLLRPGRWPRWDLWASSP